MTIAPPRPEAVTSKVFRSPTPVPSTGFRPDIEGLRAVGVLLVVAFHVAVPHLAGGFVGVDVFFVISGFLITGILLRESADRGRISLQDFYARRVRRILPAACVVLGATALAMPLFLDPLRSYRAMLDLGAALLYVGNWRFIHQNNDYLAASNDHSPALHYWSLSVEEQFYLVCPLLIVLATYAAARWRLSRILLVAVALGTLVAGSLLLDVHQTVSNPNLAYMATTTRAWQFGVGGLLALMLHAAPRWFQSPSRGARWLLWTAGWVGVGAVALAAVRFGRSTAYPGTAALLPTLGTLAIILGGSAGSTRGAVGRILSRPPVRWVGRMSYSWYLWHWPVIVLALAKWPALGLPARIALMLGALGLAWLTNRLVEMPAIRGRWFRSRGRSALVAVLVTSLAATAIVSSGRSLRTRLEGQNAPRTASAASFRSVFGRSVGRTSGAVRPSPLRAAADVPRPADCLVEHQETTPANCTSGPQAGTSVVAFGDSHMQQWQTPLQEIAHEQRWRLRILNHVGCPAALFRSDETNGALSNGCAAWRANQLARIRALRPAVVIVGSQNRRGVTESGVFGAWQRTFAQLRRSGAKIVYLQDTVTPPSDVPSCVAAHLDGWSKCRFVVRPQHQPDFVGWETQATTVSGVSRIDPGRALCRAGACPAVLNGILLYRDDSHISDTAARILEPVLARELVPLVERASKRGVDSGVAAGS